jgi:hypothetical protein
MALTFPYRFALVLYGEEGNNLGAVLAQKDWEPAYEFTRFYHQRKGELALDGDGSACVLPLWQHTLGEPYCRGCRIQIEQPGRRPVAVDFPITEFRDCASAVASAFVGQKKLREGETYTYMVVAHPAPPEAPMAGGLAVTNVSPSVPARDGSLEDYLGRAQPSGVIDADDMPVFVRRQVLEEAAAHTHAHEGTEVGGILIGKLWRDAAAREIFVEITAQIPAEYTVGNNVKLTFTAQTWAAADAALRLRNQGEVPIGYVHSHPIRTWCQGKECTPEKQRTCHLAKDFFSADDELVMRAAFPRAYCVAIVANDTAFTDLTFSMFGNRAGITQPRGFYVLEEKNSGA